MSSRRLPQKPVPGDAALPLQWDDLRYFLALARHGSLSAGSRVLAVEHATVARRVAQLEAVLGLRLFDRLARGWRLTPEGEALLPQAQAVEESALAFMRQAGAHKPLSGTVRLSAPPLLLHHFLAPRLGPLLERLSDVELVLIGETRRSDLARGEADLALRVTDPDEPDLIARPLGTMHYGLYGTAEQVARPIAQRRYLGFVEDEAKSFPPRRWLEAQAGRAGFVARSNDLDTMRVLARLGLGLVLLPRFMVSVAQADGLLPVPALQGDPPPEPTVCLALHPDLRRAPRVRAVADGLIRLFASHADAL